jgi:hypothetical protein
MPQKHKITKSHKTKKIGQIDFSEIWCFSAPACQSKQYGGQVDGENGLLRRVDS